MYVKLPCHRLCLINFVSVIPGTAEGNFKGVSMGMEITLLEAHRKRERVCGNV